MARKKKMDDPRAAGRYDNNLPGETSNEDYYEEDYYEEENTGITLRSMKRAGRYLILAIAFLILSIGLIVGYTFLYNSTLVSKERSCWLHEQEIEAFAANYVTVNGFSSMPAYVEDIPGFEGVDRKCPSGGSYTWNPVTGEYYCSEHQHYPQGFNKAESQVTGTTTLVLNANNSSSS